MSLKLNLGCGQNKIKGTVNIDVEESVKPDIVCDFRKTLPFPDGAVDSVYLFHVIEHIEEVYHPIILSEIWRVLGIGGRLFISYPEFRRCADNYINNTRGQRAFWKATIYGRQLYKSDYHIALMDSEYFEIKLIQLGFKDIEIKPEPQEDYNTVVKCVKGEKLNTYEENLRSIVFGSGK